MTTYVDEVSPEMRDALRYVIRKMAGIEREVRGIARQSGGAFTSVETGDGGMVYYDDDGNILTQIDETGTTVVQTVNGPPTPTDPDVSGVYDALVISYDGTFTDGDWTDNQVDHVEIHATALDTDALDDTNQIGTFTSSNGGTFIYPWHALDGGRWIWLQAVTTADEEGTPSNPVFQVPDVVAPTDGLPPATSPAVSLRGGIKAVFAAWTPTPNNDPVMYDVYIRNGSAPTSTAPYLIATTPGTSIGLNSFAGGAPILPTDVAYVMVVAKDADGEGPDGAVASASPVTIDTVDVTGLAITNGLIAPSAIATANIQASAITNALLAAGAVATANVQADAITSALIASGTITTGDIGATQITNALMEANAIATGNIQGLAVTAAQIANDTITAAQIAAAAVTSSELAANSVTNTAILNGAVDTLKVANLAITAAQIALTTITASQIANDTITASQIATNGVTATEIATDAVTTPKLIAGAVTAAKITADTITANEIAASAITTSELAALSVTAGKIVADTITANEIAANAITTSELAALSVNAGKIVSATITTTQIAATTIVAGNIAANTITAGQIAAGTITATQITAGTIVGSLIAAATITGGLIAAGTITASNIAASTITATQIAAGAITANKLNVSIGGGNLVPDSSFESSATTASAWTINSGTWAKDATQFWTGANSQKLVTAAENWGYYQPLGGVQDGLTKPNLTFGVSHAASVYVRSTTAQNLCLTDYGTANVQGPTVAVAANTWTRLTLVWTPASPNIFLSVRDPARVAAIGTVYFDGFQIEIGDVVTAYRPATVELLPGTIVATMVATDTLTATQIAANAITTSEIAANTILAGDISASTITTAEIAANTITASDIAAGTITAAQIAATTITAAQIAANTITAAQIAAGTITAAQIAAGTITATELSATAITGKTITGGTINGTIIQSATSGSRIEIGTGSIGWGEIHFFTPTSTSVQYGYILAMDSPRLHMQSPIGGVNTTPGTIELIAGTSAANSQLWVNSSMLVTQAATLQNGLTVTGVINSTNAIHSAANGLFMDDLNGGGVTGASIGNGGRINRTSSITMKEAIKDMTAEEAHSVLGLKSYTFRFKKDSIQSPNDPRRYPGFIAEQAAEAGAELWVGRQHKVTELKNGKYRYKRDKNGKIIYFRTAEITVAHNFLIKELFDRIEKLEAALA